MSLAWVSSVWLLVHALAAYRLTRLWTRDSLPPLPRFRQYVLDRWGNKAWAELVDCPWCAGFWISLGVALAASSPISAAWQWLSVPLAISAVVGMLAARFDTEG